MPVAAVNVDSLNADGSDGGNEHMLPTDQEDRSALDSKLSYETRIDDGELAREVVCAQFP